MLFADTRLLVVLAILLGADDAPAQLSTVEHSPERVARLLASAHENGDAQGGILAFSSAKSACLSCHKIGAHGGTVGPDLSEIGKQRTPTEIIESVLWPQRQVKPEYVAHVVLTDDGRTYRGYLVQQDNQRLELRDPTKNDGSVTILLDSIDARQEAGTLMPDNLVAAMSDAQLDNLLAFLIGLGREEGVPVRQIDSVLTHTLAHLHGPALFPYDRGPLRPEDWPSRQHKVNRDRLYEFYTKQADYFQRQEQVPPLLQRYPGIDGGQLGHWGNQNEDTWIDDRWNVVQLSSVQCGIFRGNGITVPRGVCVQLGDKFDMATCFNPDTLTYDAVWTGGFLEFSDLRHGFMDGVALAGTPQPRPEGQKPIQPFEYHGFYRHGKRVVFSYRIGEKEYLDSPWVEGGEFVRTVAVHSKLDVPRQLDVDVKRSELLRLLENQPAQWPQQIETTIDLGSGSPYSVDTIGLPTTNPWNALLFCGGHAFLPDGSALVCTIQGDVWRVKEFESPSTTATWRRFASGLNHSLGIVVDDDGIFVLGRDQITRLHDLNGDGEADKYECFSKAYTTSAAGHDFICGLERDVDGNFYLASGNQGIVRISSDGQRGEVIATGLRNPAGLAVTPEGLVTVPCSEGEWTPASMICAFRPHQPKRPHFGYRGPIDDQVPKLPLVYLPRGLDNSSGGQTTVTSDRWGPLRGSMLHFSIGTGTHFLLLRDEVAGQLQGAVVPLPGEFRSGAHRGRFSPSDGQLYVTGMQGWACYATDDGCFQRVRYDDEPVQMPVAFHVHQNGVTIEFSSTLDKHVVKPARNHFAQCWNYRYGPGYGSPEFSTKHAGTLGHDSLEVKSAHVLEDGRTMFLEIPELQPVNQLHLRVQVAATAEGGGEPGDFRDLFLTVHKLDPEFTRFPGYVPLCKTINAHPIFADLQLAAKTIPNPYGQPITPARKIAIATGTNLSFATRSFRVQPGEAIHFTLRNPDVVPHNWAVVKPGTLERVGQLANQLISDPEAAVRQYIPLTDDVLAYTDVVLPSDQFTIFFRAPTTPGRYPYLCTFPGHWLVMNGEMIVEEVTADRR
jgi:putative heme-binding domain-containing protein